MRLLEDLAVKNKKVLLRADFNVLIDPAGRVMDDFRIKATLPTIQYLKEQGAKIIILTHLGRPGGVRDMKFSLASVKQRLDELLGENILLAPDCVGEEVKKMSDDLSAGQILLLENLRFYEAEEKNEAAFAAQLASLGEAYINDAFGVSHRAHASVEAITKFLPSGAGLLLQKEVVSLTRVRDNPEAPLCVIIGGAKISTKIKLILSFLGKAQDIILGGALANTVLVAKGIAVGKSFVEKTMLPELGQLEITDTKIHLPVDAVLCSNKDGTGLCRTGPVGKVGEEELLLDIGVDSCALFDSVISRAKTIIWNGPMGLFETAAFSHGTKAVAEAIARSTAFSVTGGGETVAFLEELKLVDKFSFVSTGGGAMMEFLSGDKLPGLAALER
ncbi:MAG: phosphoglycerate kinase [Patescibacteria group bacterium]